MSILDRIILPWKRHAEYEERRTLRGSHKMAHVEFDESEGGVFYHAWGDVVCNLPNEFNSVITLKEARRCAEEYLIEAGYYLL